jgi:spermidine synthase
MAMGFATDDPDLRRTTPQRLAERHAAAGGFATRYWTPDLQAGAFALPRFIADLVAAA